MEEPEDALKAALESGGYTLTTHMITEGVIVCRAIRGDGLREEVTSASVREALKQLVQKLRLEISR